MRKIAISIMTLALVGAACLNFSGCEPEPEPVKVTGVSVSPKNHEMEIGGKITLTATVTPSDAENKTVTWTSDKPATATVNAATGEVTAVAKGKAVITATTTDGGLTDKCTVTVLPEPEPEPDPDENRITAFSISFSQNGSLTDHSGTIDHTAGRISVGLSKWIDNLSDATATFTTAGKSVEVDGTQQVSGSTKNNFMEDIVYTVIAESGAEREYTVEVSAPQKSGLPIVKIDTKNQAPILNKEDYVTSTFTIIDPNDPDNNISEAAAGVRGRGNTTWNYDKKPYRVKLEEKESVFGLTSAKNWVLLANWQDPTYLMNSVGFELSRMVELPFSPTAINVEFFLNGEHRGSYTVGEHIQVNEGRVDIDEEQDVFLEIDTYWDEDPKFKSTGLELPVMFKSPEDVSDADIAEVKAEFDAMENAVMTLTGWRDHLDVESFINFMIVNELTRNIELGHPKSTYLFKKSGEKWTWGPVWDLDWAYGYTGGGQNYWKSGSAESLLYITGEGFNDTGVSSNEAGVKFFTRLFQDEGFKAEFKARWNEVKPSIVNIDEFVAEMGGKLPESDMYNKKVWGYQYSKNFSSEISSMQTWLTRRIDAMDEEIAGW